MQLLLSLKVLVRIQNLHMKRNDRGSFDYEENRSISDFFLFSHHVYVNTLLKILLFFNFGGSFVVLVAGYTLLEFGLHVGSTARRMWSCYCAW